MDPIRYGFMETIVQFIEGFVDKLPPLLQLLFGLFVTLGIIKGVMLVAEYVERKRSGED